MCCERAAVDDAVVAVDYVVVGGGSFEPACVVDVAERVINVLADCCVVVSQREKNTLHP